MKIKKLDKKLMLKKETVTNLNSREMKSLKGGVSEETYCLTDCRTRCGFETDCRCTILRTCEC